MIQPTRVLPSNAPPLLDGADNLHHASRVLQEHSGNRQQHDFGYSSDYSQKYSGSGLTENAYARHHQPLPHQPAQHLYHPQPRHHQAWRPYGNNSRRGFPYPTAEDEARIHFESERLYRRFRQSDQYIKYRNRQSKDDKGNGDQKWPDHLEKAFFRALVQWQPMGRRKVLHKDKQRGRNELIADCIEEMTGERRSRKQVSSHIQVLKPFVEGDSLIMKWLSKDDFGTQPGGRHAHYGGGRRMSNYPVTVPPHGVRSTMPDLPRAESFNPKQLKADIEAFQPVDFQMFVQSKHKDAAGHEEAERLHTYSQSVTNPQGPDLLMNDWATIERDFPLLSAMHAQRPFDCNILVAEASLAFPTETFKEKDGTPMPGVELGISFLCSSRQLPPTKDNGIQVVCNNFFYENGQRAKDANGTEYSGPSDVRFEPSDRHGFDSSVDTQIKFGSGFWAKVLGGLAKQLLDKTKDHAEEVTTYIRNITAVQEVFVSSQEHQGYERILVIHWTFRKSTAERGRASWRKLVLPSSSSQFAQPTPYVGIPIKDERADPLFDSCTHFVEIPVCHAPPQQSVQPTLQSPFEYDGSSGSALSSATWPTSIEDGSVIGGSHSAHPDFATDNTFDFHGGNINIAYDPTLNFDNFDSTAFDFDTAVNAGFAADPALADFSQSWYDGQPNAFDPIGQQQAVSDVVGTLANVGAEGSFSTQPDLDAHAQMYGSVFPSQYEQHHQYANAHSQQAYCGAGQDFVKDEGALAALADASYLASTLGQHKDGAIF